jgi:MFS family permease
VFRVEPSCIILWTEGGPLQDKTTTTQSTFASLSYRDYRLLWLGQLGASASLWMEQVARPLLIYSLTESALWVGLIAATRMLPQLLLGLLAGVLADRLDKKKILLLSQTITLSMHALTAALLLTNVITPWMVFVTTFISGASQAFNQPARQSLIPRLVPAESLSNAIALNSAARNVMRIGGASLAGLLLLFVEMGGLYVIQAVLYVWVMLWTYQLPAQPKSSPVPASSSLFFELREGLSAARQDPAIRSLLSLSLLLFVFGIPYQSVFIPLLSLQVLHRGETGAGLLLSLTGAGALIGSLMVARFASSITRHGLVMSMLLVLFGVGLVILSRAETLLLVVPALLITGATHTSFMSLNNAFVLSRTAPELQGRVMSLFSLDRGLVPLGATLAGFLASQLGPQDGLLVMACICLAGALFALRALRGLS